MIASMVHSGPLSRSMKLMEDKAKNIAIPMERSAILILDIALLGFLRVGLVW